MVIENDVLKNLLVVCRNLLKMYQGTTQTRLSCP